VVDLEADNHRPQSACQDVTKLRRELFGLLLLQSLLDNVPIDV
jgi:hypothetical protein